ncbi:hypothetical protein COD69_13190 [Bacillus thuringiensis]|nr:hypothetical protein COD69_13190 [Bacillus thuringiensis]
MEYPAIFPSLKKSCIFLILFLSMLIITFPAPTFCYYSKNANVAKKGSTIYIRSGIYSQKVRVTQSGASGASITFQNYQDEKVILYGLKVKLEDDGLFTIENKYYIQIRGLEFRNLRSTKVNETPIGIYITGTGSYIDIRNNYIHHIEANVKGGNAHSIAVYGTSSSAQNNLNPIVIDNNELANLKLEVNEVIAVNGNIDSFQVTNNKVYDKNIMEFVLIGHEGVSLVATLDRHNASINNHYTYQWN